MGNTASRSRAGASVHTSRAEQVEEDSRRSEGKLKETTAHEETAVRIPRNAAEESAASAAAAQRLKQSSNWSLGSLSGRLNWSFTGASRNSFHNRSKYSRKSFSAVQQRRSKTAWHKPLTNSIFSTHFKEASRNEQFHIQHLIAKGAFGVVFKVIDKHTQGPAHEHQKPYALKVLKKSKIIEENSVQQIKDEADIQKLCGHHPFIVQQIDLWQNRRNLHILSEFIPNGELFSKITAFSTDLIRLYLAEIGLAIDFLHNAGIIYRDAKPENILLTETFHIKLVDFGLSKWLKLGATTKTMCGTFQYMAPEILRGEPYGHAVDWWSLGIIACLMFTRKSPDVKQFLQVALPPEVAASLQIEFQDETDDIGLIKRPSIFKGQNDVSEIWASQNFLPNEVEHLPHESKDVLKRLLEIDPRQRLRSILALQRIALYKNFKIDSKHLQSISPLDIMAKDNIAINRADQFDESHSAEALKAFQGF